MKTNIIMKRPLFNINISQRTDNSFLSATDLVKAGNIYRMSNGNSAFNMNSWFANKDTKLFILELENNFGKVKINSTGKFKHTWIHPLLFIDMALTISPKLKIETYKWLYDELINNRCKSGDSYKLMCGNLFARHGNKQTFPIFIASTATKIKTACKAIDWITCTEQQLQLRDDIHKNIALLADILNNNDEAVRLGILKTKGVI